MKLDLDEIVNGVLPEWEFTVKDGEADYETNPPTLGELAALQSITHKSLNAEEGERLILSLFWGKSLPPVASWPPGKRRAFVVGYLNYWAVKNYQAVALKAQAAVTAAINSEAAAN